MPDNKNALKRFHSKLSVFAKAVNKISQFDFDISYQKKRQFFNKFKDENFHSALYF